MRGHSQAVSDSSQRAAGASFGFCRRAAQVLFATGDILADDTGDFVTVHLSIPSTYWPDDRDRTYACPACSVGGQLAHNVRRGIRGESAAASKPGAARAVSGVVEALLVGGDEVSLVAGPRAHQRRMAAW